MKIKYHKENKWNILDPRRKPEGSCVCLSVSQSVSLSVRNFSQNWHAGFFWFLSWSYGSIRAQNWQSPIFWKNPVRPKFGDLGPKIVFFGLLHKIEPKELAGNSLKRRVLLLSNFSRKPHVREKSGSRDFGTKALDQSDRSIFQTTISFEPYDRFL